MISAENLAALFRQAPEMFCVLSGPEHRFELVNEAHIRVLGFDASGMTVRQAQPESVEVHGLLDEVYRTGTTAVLRQIPVTVTDRLRYFDLTYAARRDREGTIDGVLIVGSEVTDQVLARRALDDQRRWLESVLDRLPSATLFVDPRTGKVTFINAAAQHMMGAPVAELDAGQVMHTREIQVRRNGAPITFDELPSTRITRGETLRGYEISLETPTGCYEISASSDRIPETLGQPETALLVLQDVTAQKRAQQLLQRSEEQLSLALSTSRVGFYDWDVLADSMEFSPQMRADWGMEPDHSPMTFQDAMRFIHPEDREWTQAKVEAALRERAPYHVEYRVARPDGKMVWVEVRGQVQFAADGRPKRFFGTSIDISHRVESERALRALADSMPQVVWTALPDGTLDYTNKRWTEYSGSSEPARWLDFVHPADREQAVAAWVTSVTTGSKYQIEFRLLRQSDQSYRWHLVRANPSLDEAGRINRWFGTCTDIEDQKRGEAELRAANLAAESASAAKTAFLANMSHEIRTPLGAILGFVELMKSPRSTRDNIATYISVVERNSGHLLRIVDDILDLSKVEAGQMLVEQAELSLPSLLADFASFIGMQARERAVTFELRPVSPLPELVVSDATRIRQILTNVVGNALKFTESGGVTIEVAYHAPLLRFVVTDTGIGISEADQVKLFQAFTQGDVSITRQFGGTGLGLVLTRRLCQLLGGELTLVRSEVGIGSTFQATVRVGVPVRTGVTAASSKLPSAFRHEAPHQELLGRRILVVEDLPDNQELLRILLTNAGATVEVAGDGEQGVRAALRGPHDAVLMDIQMPNVDGYTAARRLRSQGYAQPLIALTAHAMKDERQQIVAAGFSDYLSKPIVRDLLIDALLRCAAQQPPLTVVMVDDDEDLLGVMSVLLSERDYAIVAVRSAAEALTAIDRVSGPLVVMTDLSMPGVSGDMLGQQLRERPDRQRMRVLAVSGWQDVAERARAFGADGFVRKPFDLQKMLTLIAEFARDLA